MDTDVSFEQARLVVSPTSTSEWTQTLALKGQALNSTRASAPLFTQPALTPVPSPDSEFDFGLTHPSLPSYNPPALLHALAPHLTCHTPKDLYKKILRREVDTVNGEQASSKNALLNIVMQLRKACNHP